MQVFCADKNNTTSSDRAQVSMILLLNTERCVREATWLDSGCPDNFRSRFEDEWQQIAEPRYLSMERVRFRLRFPISRFAF
jgi:hypothetical protein